MTTIENLRCFRCDEPGHVAAECTTLSRAADWKEHLSRIDAIKRRFLDGDIKVAVKTRLIKAENESWYGKNIPAALNR